MSEVTRTPLFAAVAWLTVPIAWGIDELLDQGFGEFPDVFGLIGWVALVAASVLTLLVLTRAVIHTSLAAKAALGTFVLGLITTGILFWAIPLWAGLYGIAMILYAVAEPRLRRGAIVTAVGMAASIVAMVTVSALEVGTPDEYGDYPIAWIVAYALAATGAAAGMLILWREDRERAPVAMT